MATEPVLAVALAAARLWQGDADGALPHLEAAESGLAGLDGPDRTQAGLWLAALRVLHGTAVRPASPGWLDREWVLASQAHADPRGVAEHRALGVLWLALGLAALRDFDTQLARSALLHAGSQLSAGGLLALRERAKSWEALACALYGDLAAATRLAASVSDGPHGEDAELVPVLALAGAAVSLARDEPETAGVLLDQADLAVMTPRPAGEPSIGVVGGLLRARVALAEGNLAGARGLVRWLTDAAAGAAQAGQAAALAGGVIGATGVIGVTDAANAADVADVAGAVAAPGTLAGATAAESTAAGATVGGATAERPEPEGPTAAGDAGVTEAPDPSEVPGGVGAPDVGRPSDVGGPSGVRGPHGASAVIAALDAEISLAAGERERARATLADLISRDPAAVEASGPPEALVGEARLLVADSDDKGALALVAPLLADMAGTCSVTDRIAALLTAVVAHRRLGQASEAAELLSQALALAEPEDACGPFISAGSPLRSALTVLISPSSRCAGFASRILDRFEADAAAAGRAGRCAADRQRARCTAVPALAHDKSGDRGGAVPVDQHHQDAPELGLPQARRSEPASGHRAGPPARAALAAAAR